MLKRYPIAQSRIYIPADWIDDKRVLKREFERKEYSNFNCRKCKFFKMRHSPHCDPCEFYLGDIQMWIDMDRDGERYIGFPIGDIDRLADLLDLDIRRVMVDKRQIHLARHGLRFTGKLRRGEIDPATGIKTADQVALLKEWEKSNYESGMIISSTRSGKTVMAVYTMTEIMPYKTIITASQGTFLDQFEDRLYETTNLRQLEKQRIYPVLRVERPKDLDLIDKYDPDICIFNYQKFITEAGIERVWDYLRGRFSAVHVDEADQAAAKMFSSFVNRLDCRIKVGWSATIKRKDGLEKVVHWVIGPIRAEMYTAGIKPRIRLLETGIGNAKNYAQWSSLEKFMLEHKTRNAMLRKDMWNYLEANTQHSILFPVRRTQAILDMVKEVNLEAAQRRLKGFVWPQETAAAFYAKTGNKPATLQAVRDGRHRILVGQSSMTARGIDVGTWTRVYVGTTPSSDPTFMYQMGSRVSTPAPDKPPSDITMILDNLPAGVACFKILWENAIKPFLDVYADDNGKMVQGEHAGKDARYTIDKPTLARILEIVKYPKSYVPPQKSREMAGDGTQRSFSG